MKALILAGGFGTRLKEIVSDVPKPLASIAGKPFLEYQLRYLREQGIKEVILAVHHMSDKIKSYFGNGLRLDMNLIYSEEEVPLGTAGAIKKAQKYLDDTFIVINGDSYSPVNLTELVKFHKSKNSSFTVCMAKNNEAGHYGNLVVSQDKIIGFSEKSNASSGLINAGVYVFEPKIFELIELDKNVSLEREIFPKLAEERSLFCYLHNGYFSDIGRPETFLKFRDKVVSSLLVFQSIKVKDAMYKMVDMVSNVLFVVDQDKKLLGVITEKIINRYLLSGGNLNEAIGRIMVKDPVVAKTSYDQSKIKEMLLSGIYRLPIVDDNGILRNIEFYSEQIKSESFPIIRGKAPLRISFAGGGTDLPYFFEKYGGAVINATIDKYCHVTLVKRADSKIIINSDLGEDVILDSKDNINYDGKFDLIKAIIKIMKPDFGFELYITNDMPPGRGLGSSATLSVLLVRCLGDLMNKNYDDYKTAQVAYNAEREELKIKGGWQDQYAAVTGGFNFMEFNQEKTIIYPLRLKEENIEEFNSHLMLCYVGGSHFSGDLHSNQEKNFVENEEEVVKNLTELKSLAVRIKDCLLTNDLETIGMIMHESWEKKKKINHHVSNMKIDFLYDVGIKNGAFGGRLLGAGGGGYILFFHSPKKRNQLKKALEKEGGEVINFNFEFKGTNIRTVKKKN